MLPGLAFLTSLGVLNPRPTFLTNRNWFFLIFFLLPPKRTVLLFWKMGFCFWYAFSACTQKINSIWLFHWHSFTEQNYYHNYKPLPVPPSFSQKKDTWRAPWFLLHMRIVWPWCPTDLSTLNSETNLWPLAKSQQDMLSKLTRLFLRGRIQVERFITCN